MFALWSGLDVNFIGHLFVARFHSFEPGYGLGSMLPDFAGMAGVRMSEPSAHNVRAGIQLHHATDHVFHHAPAFVELMGMAFEALTARDVARGPARAVAHIGVEMMIDGELLHDEALGHAYLEAISEMRAHAEELARDDAGRARLILVGERLYGHGVPHEYRNTDAVVRRLGYLLSHRPRLAIDDTAAEVVRSVLPEVQSSVRARLPEIVATLVSALSKDAILVR